MGEFGRVRITKPFYLGTTEVTQGEYERVMGANPSEFQGDPACLVESISWGTAAEFCRKLGERPEKRAVGAWYRLPTEAEWAYACRAGTATPWSSGADPKALKDVAWFSANSGQKTHPVRQRMPNAWGLYDMHGNVFEWCQDRRDEGYYAASPLEDPPGATEGWRRIVRGGAWAYGPGMARAACRTASAPTHDGSNYGCRVVRPLSVPAP